jgi:hypothetical protein
MAEYFIAKDKLQHIYDLHAADFGLFESKNTKRLQMLADAIESHMSDADTNMVPGKYRGQDAKLYFNSRTNLVIVTSSVGGVLAGFKASPAQTGHIQRTGRLN